MTIAHQPSERIVGALGDRGRDGVLRRLIAAAIGSWLFPPTSVLAVPVAYLAVLPVSYLAEQRWPGRPGGASFVRYGLLGGLLGGALGVALHLLQGLPVLWLLTAVAIGSVSGGVGAGLASILPARWVLPTALLGTAFTVGMLAVVAAAGLPALA